MTSQDSSSSVSSPKTYKHSLPTTPKPAPKPTSPILLTDVQAGDEVEVLLKPTGDYRKLKVRSRETDILVLVDGYDSIPMQYDGVSPLGYFVVVAHYPREKNGV